jgi:hypothetical protein
MLVKNNLATIEFPLCRQLQPDDTYQCNMCLQPLSQKAIAEDEKTRKQETQQLLDTED